MSLPRSLREGWEVARDLLLGRYPEFVTGGPLPKGQVPVFVFHSLEPVSFERKLAHLTRNGYATLTAEELFEVLMGARAAPERAVALTFDDARGSVWGVGLPLLRRHGLRGTVFAVPGRLRSRPPGPSWDDVLEQRVEPARVLERERGEGAFMSWEELELAARSGVLEFESHTLRHARVHVAPVVAGFLTPQLQRGYAAMDVPLLREGERDLLAAEAPLGMPLLRSAPRTAEAVRFVEEPSFREPALRRVADGGGEAFFGRPGWERELREALAGVRPSGRLETPAERERALRHELGEARRLLEERTGRPVVHLCYPWHAAGPTARRLAREVGYRTAFCGKVAGVPISPIGGDPHAIARISEDFLECLPGQGRRSVVSVLRHKWVRRFGAGS